VQNPTITLAGDVSATKLILDSHPRRDSGRALLRRGCHH
jgi:hypothetical protein